jgi:FKBP-type peptidyl-prolyl cis-trans isomerase
MAKKWMLILAVFLLAAEVNAQQAPPVLKTEQDMQSYSLGVENARNYQKADLGIDLNLVIQGMKDVAAGGMLLVDDDTITSALKDFRSKLMAKARGDRKIAGLGNRKEEDEFFTTNMNKEGVTALPSGLQYKILKTGEGPKPTKADTVEVNYRGTHLDGKEIENTFNSGNPITIRISDTRVMIGMREALELMPVGSRWQLFIPSRLAYRGAAKGPRSGASNYAVIYEVELLAIKR